MRYLTRTIWILSLVSLFTDMASEMLYPIMPIYLREIGFSVLLIGVLEGVAEATAGLSKGWFGKWSDARSRRTPFVQWGYALSSISKPMMGVFVAPLWIFFARTIDRLGKGIRTGARDAMLSDEATAGNKGKVFGFHRSMDTLGAVLGPAFALLYLHFHPKAYQALFFIAFAPSVLAILASLLLRDKSQHVQRTGGAGPFFGFLKYWKNSPVAYRRLVTGLLLFALFNSSDVFLLLQAKSAGLTDAQTIGAYIFYNLIYALAAFPLGILADRIGLRPTLLLGLGFFAVVYFGMAAGGSLVFIGFLFLLYGLYAAATEGIAKAWITEITDPKDTATAIGTYAGFQSLCALLASSFAGLLWFAFGPAVTFAVTGTITLWVIAYLLRYTRQRST
ncbi:MAG: MFS transporter [Bacteroidetes bacterium]|nr:MFS transporter [Bacteroidota bacterium]MBS1941918.1 MFS transporter [Bacteroidota bacterium]